MSKSIRTELSEMHYNETDNVVTVRGKAQISRNVFKFVYILHSTGKESVILTRKAKKVTQAYSNGKQKKFEQTIKNKCRDSAVKLRTYATHT